MRNDNFDDRALDKWQEESTREKSWEEKSRRDPISSIVWAVILVWAGLVLLANNLGYLDIGGFPRVPSDNDFPGQFLAAISLWNLILLGAGVIVLLGVVARLALPEYRRPAGGELFIAIFLIGIGLGNMFSWDIVWPMILIGLGIVVLMRGYMRRR